MGAPILNPKTLGINPNPCGGGEEQANWQRLVQVLNYLNDPAYRAAQDSGLTEIPDTEDIGQPPQLGGVQWGLIVGTTNTNRVWQGTTVTRIVQLILVDGPDGVNRHSTHVFDALVLLGIEQTTIVEGVIVPWILARGGFAIVLGGGLRPWGTIPTSNCAALFGTPLDEISGYSSGSRQYLAHESGSTCLVWKTPGSC